MSAAGDRRITDTSGAAIANGIAAGGAPGSRGPRYEAVVNKKSINMQVLTNQLNQRWDGGWRLAHIYEQGSNTCMIFNRRPW